MLPYRGNIWHISLPLGTSAWHDILLQWYVKVSNSLQLRISAMRRNYFVFMPSLTFGHGYLGARERSAGELAGVCGLRGAQDRTISEGRRHAAHDGRR